MPLQISSLQFSHSVVSDSLWPHGLQHARLPCPLPTPGTYPSTHVHRVGDAIQPSHPLSLPSPPTFNLSQHQGLCIRWPKDQSFSFSVSPSSEFSGLISFRMNWLDLLAVQGTLKSLLQHHSSKASILRPLQIIKPSYFKAHTSKLRWGPGGGCFTLTVNSHCQ